jgi:hypothetical protein
MNGVEFVDIAYELEIYRDTASSWCVLLREAMCFYVSEHREMLGGINEDGSKKVVEIDESLFSRRKYQRGRLLGQQWFVACIERAQKNVLLSLFKTEMHLQWSV